MKKLISILAVLFSFINSSFAENKNNDLKTAEEKRAEFVLINMQNDYITCYSFYKIGAEYVRQTDGKTNIIEGIEKSSDNSLKLAHETDEIMGMTSSEMSSKVKQEMKNQLTQIDNDFNNASILLKKYGIECKNLIEDKKQRISFWEKKANVKFKNE